MQGQSDVEEFLAASIKGEVSSVATPNGIGFVISKWALPREAKASVAAVAIVENL